MRNIILIVFSIILGAFACSSLNIGSQGESEKIKKLITGRWVLSTDERFIVEIRNDTMAYYYDGDLEYKNPFVLSIKDSISYYEKEGNVFNFMKDDKLSSKVEIKEFDTLDKDTVVNTVVYLDEKGMDLIARNRSISFSKLK